MCLRAPHDNTVLLLLHDMEEQIRVGLLVGRQGTVSPGVRHGCIADQILCLDAIEKAPETGVVLRSHLFIRLPGDAVQGVHAVEPRAALKAGRRLLAHEAQHLHLLDHVPRTALDVAKTIDRLVRQR